MSGESEATVRDNEANQPLKSLGKYLIERKLGQGGMGTVYLARHADLKRLIALKVLPRDKAKNPTLVRRFKAEAQAAAHLEHPNIVAVYDTGEADGYLYITMEYVDGIDLFEYLKRRKTVPVKRSIEIIKQAASALQHAFEQNIVHRDIKPSNLMLRRDGTLKLTDLGLARSVDETLETNITRAGTTVGTVDYMAPEQARNSKLADIRSDIYSLGCTWYQMLTGQPPFPEGGMMNKLAAHSIKPLPDPRAINENVPEGIFAILQRMTAKKPEDRYQTPAELLEDINRSKLTKAAFSKEILNDLDDDDSETNNAVEEDEDEIEEDKPVRRQTRSRVEDDDEDVAYDESVRRKKRPRIEDDDEDFADDVPAARRSRSRNDDDVDDSDDEPSGKNRRSHRTAEDETASADSTQPFKSRSKRPSRGDDEEPDEPSSRRTRNSQSSSKTNSNSNAKTNASSSGENRSTPSKSDKKTPSSTLSSQKPPASGTKPLPPKRQPLENEPQPQFSLDFDTLKIYGIIAIVVSVLGGAGWMFFTAKAPKKSTTFATNQVPVKAEEKPAQVTQPVDPQSVAKESANTNFAERPAVDFDIRSLPAWAAAESPLPNNLTTFTVGSGSTTANHFSDINEALRATENKGGILRLQGNGPFLLSSVELRNAKKLVIMAANAEGQPLIILKPSESNLASGLTVNNCELDLRGLHFVLSQSSHTSPTSNSMVSVAEGQMFVRNCSFTSMVNDGTSSTALTFSSQQDSTSSPALDPQILIDRVAIRGNGLAGLRIHRTTANVVIRDSLFVTGSAPAIEVAGQLIPGVPDSIQGRPRRIIRVLQTTMCARKHLMELAVQNTQQPPSTAILFRDSVCSAEGIDEDAVLVSAARWPTVKTNPNGWLTNLNWTSMSSLFLGFEELLELEKSSGSYKVNGIETWQRVWGGKKFEPNQFQTIHWQEALIPDHGSVLPSDFDNAKLPYLDVKTANGSLPGCSTNRIKVPEVISQSRLFAMSQRAAIPAVASQPFDLSQARKVDLMKEDLAEKLNKSDWPTGTVFEVSGSGIKSMLPVKISDKSVQIVFRQLEGGPPLKIQPKAKSDTQGLFTIENGALDIQSMVLEAVPPTKSGILPWLINAKNSNVILRGCQFSCPQEKDVEQHLGLIQWTTSDSAQQSSIALPRFLSISDSLLMSTGMGIRAECSHGNVFVRNSIVATRGNGICFLPTRSDKQPTATLDLEHVTFSATKAAIRVETAAQSPPLESPARLFIKDCAVVDPLEFKDGEAVDAAVIEVVGLQLDQKQIEWWGNSNGFANDVRTLLRQPNVAPISTPAGWQTAWGEYSDIRLLSGPKGVELSKHLPNKWNALKATSFALDPGSQSATWADGSQPIGANIHHIEEALTLKKVLKEPKTAPGTTKKMLPNRPTPSGAGF